LLATVNPLDETAGTIRFEFVPLQKQDVPKETVSRFKSDFVHWCFSENIELLWPKTPLGVITAKDPVADYLFAHYRPCRALSARGFWQFVFMVRKGENCE
jgi:hypothetical protein